MKSIKEKQLLVKWAKAMNEPIDPALLEEVERYDAIQKDIIESVRSNSIKDLAEASIVAEQFVEKINIDYPKPPTLDEVLNVLKEEQNELVQTQAAEVPTETQRPSSLAERAAEHITKEIKLEEKADSFQQPDPLLVNKNLTDIQKKLKFLEQAIGKIAATGPGGGAGDIINLDMPTKTVTGDYTITRRDYYVGVNTAVKTYITLPDPSTISNGREVIIKDESGHAQLTPIKVIGNIDNDPNGAEIRINNGSITLLYNNGWRIV